MTHWNGEWLIVIFQFFNAAVLLIAAFRMKNWVIFSTILLVTLVMALFATGILSP